MAIEIVFSSGGTVEVLSGRKTERPGRGASILALLSDYVSVDVETTGLSPVYNEIIEVSAIRVRGGQIVDRFSSLVCPSDMSQVDEYITALTGISPAMLETAPSAEKVFPAFLDFVGSDVLVGHNVAFDVNFIYDACSSCGLPTFGNDYIDTCRLSRRAFPDLPNHKLATIAKKCGVPQDCAHRAEADAETAALCYEYMIQYARDNNLEDVLQRAHSKRNLRASDIVGNPELLRTDSPLYGRVVVFTGALEKMTRKEAMQLVADLGGINADSVTKKTNFLVLGNNDLCSSIKDGKSSKHKKAEKYILGGADLSIIPENVFYDMLDE